MAYVPNSMVHCPNCGTDFTPQPPYLETATAICPVCNYALGAAVGEGMAQDDRELVLNDTDDMVLEAFERKLSDFVQQAYAGGMSFERISTALRDELAFVAELSKPGRRHVVQIIDLGPEDQSTRFISPAEARQVLQRPTRVN